MRLQKIVTELHSTYQELISSAVINTRVGISESRGISNNINPAKRPVKNLSLIRY